VRKQKDKQTIIDKRLIGVETNFQKKNPEKCPGRVDILIIPERANPVYENLPALKTIRIQFTNRVKLLT